ncbi:DUF1097 domain-containing protein [Polaromonas sp. P1(28)-13]|nr:DUF1097 domain-containing protein [Polaromonas sp. P1(28)-13]
MKSFILLTVAAAVTAAAAAGLSATLALPVWAMFIGWVAFFTRGITARDGIVNALCVALGLGFGMAAALGLGALGPALGALALPLVVFAVAVVVVSLRAAPVLNNILCYFLGLIAFFASHLPPSLAAFAGLASAVVLGSLAAWTAHAMQHRITRSA